MCGCMCVTDLSWLNDWMMKSCQGKITAAFKILKPAERKRDTLCSIREKALREDYVHSSLVFTHLYATDCFLCVANWCLRGFGSFCPFGYIYTCANVFVWQEFSFCASVCVCTGPLALRVTSNRTVRNCYTTSWTPWEWRRQRWVCVILVFLTHGMMISLMWSNQK